MTQKKQLANNQTNTLFEEITSHCDNLSIARYLKNEIKDTLKYFHSHKLSNIKDNITEFSNYIIFLNSENCKKIESLSSWKGTKRKLNNSITYFYNHESITNKELSAIQKKIETNFYETITMMQSIKWSLILTIDEFCNASSTRMDIIRYNLWKKQTKKS